MQKTTTRLMTVLFCSLFSFILVEVGSSVKSIVHAAFSPIPNAAAPTDTDSILTIGGFNAIRANISSLPEGAAFEEARSSLAAHYPQVTYTAVTTLTQPALADVDILVLSPTYDGFIPMTPLTTAEQTALLDYVTGGGCAILLPDNQDFAAANESLIDPFGMDITGMIWSWSTVSVLDPSATPLTSGFHGAVPSFTQGWPGGLTDIGPHGTAYAANGLGTALAVIETDVIAQSSGAVMVYSDATTFLDSTDGGGFVDNETLFLNSVAFCQRRDTYLPLMLRGVTN
jgi:hypothetical protein